MDHLSFGSPRARTINFAGILLLLASIPTDYLWVLPVRSLAETVFHFRPYSSGIMRALSRLLHGDLEGALAYNQLVLPVFVVIVALLVVNAWAWNRAARARNRNADRATGRESAV